MRIVSNILGREVNGKEFRFAGKSAVECVISCGKMLYSVRKQPWFLKTVIR